MLISIATMRQFWWVSTECVFIGNKRKFLISVPNTTQLHMTLKVLTGQYDKMYQDRQTDRQTWENSADPDQMPHLILVCTKSVRFAIYPDFYIPQQVVK